MLKALVFDFDGVIADSEPIHHQAFLRLSQAHWQHRFTWQTYVQRYVGFDDRDAIRTLMADAGVPAADEATLAHLIAEKGDHFEAIVRAGVSTFPGTVEFIRQAAAAMPLAIASGATRRDIDLILARLGLAGLFEPIISADLVHRSKPHPQTYHLAVEGLARRAPALALEPGVCLAIEDTAAGIDSARAAGLPTLALETSSPHQALLRADRVVPSLEGLSVAQLMAWFA